MPGNQWEHVDEIHPFYYSSSGSSQVTASRARFRFEGASWSGLWKLVLRSFILSMINAAESWDIRYAAHSVEPCMTHFYALETWTKWDTSRLYKQSLKICASKSYMASPNRGSCQKTMATAIESIRDASAFNGVATGGLEERMGHDEGAERTGRRTPVAFPTRRFLQHHTGHNASLSCLSPPRDPSPVTHTSSTLSLSRCLCSSFFTSPLVDLI